MLIKNIQINNFGKLKNKNIELQNGINIINGENESGKTTLLKFITSMFYGISKNKNGKRISDYERYTPWENGEFSGKITYKLDNNNEYEVYRNFTKKNPQVLDNFGNDVSKNYTIDKTYGNKFFIEQTKVDEELFNMAMVIMQQEVKLDEKKQNILIQKASNIMLTGEDDVSYKKIISKLNKKQTEEIGTEKSPTKPLYLTKQKIEKLKEEKIELDNILDLQYELDDKKATIKKDEKEAEQELELLQNLQKMQNEIKLEEEKININNKSKEEIEIKKKEEEEKLNNIKIKKIEKKSFQKLYIIPILLTILLFFIINQKIITYTVVALDILSIIFISFINIKENKKYKQIKEKEKQEKNSIENKIEMIENEIKEKEKIIKEKENELQIKININKEEIKNKFKEIKDINNLLKNEIKSENILNQQRYINDLKLELTKLEMQRKEVLEKLENKAQIEEKIKSLQENLEDLINYNEAINIAKEEIDIAYLKMKENVTPKFSSNLSKAIQNISKGKYKTVKVNEENGLIVETENGNYVPADVLSIGTIDQLYLSLRISSINELTKENMPIILDETFAYFDNERLKNVLEFLSKEYKDRQILILTCTNRENEILDKMNIEYNKIEL